MYTVSIGRVATLCTEPCCLMYSACACAILICNSDLTLEVLNLMHAAMPTCAHVVCVHMYVCALNHFWAIFVVGTTADGMACVVTVSGAGGGRFMWLQSKLRFRFSELKHLLDLGKIPTLRLNFNTHWMGYSTCFGEENALWKNFFGLCIRNITLLSLSLSPYANVSHETCNVTMWRGRGCCVVMIQWWLMEEEGGLVIMGAMKFSCLIISLCLLYVSVSIYMLCKVWLVMCGRWKGLKYQIVNTHTHTHTCTLKPPPLISQDDPALFPPPLHVHSL